MTDVAAMEKAARRALLKNARDLAALVNLGVALRLQGRAEEAEKACRRALSIRPFEPTALRCLGGLMMLQGRFDEAIVLADAALAVRPDSGAAWLIKGDALANSHRREAAIEAYATAQADAGTALEAQVRIGRARRVLGQIDAALQAFDDALALDPMAAEPRYERGLLRLQNRQFAAGWDDYESRWTAEAFARSRGQVPQALVEQLARAPTIAQLAGRRVLLIGEQGLGDQLMFASILPDLVRAAASVVCVCEPRLIRLLSHSFPQVRFVAPADARIDSDEVDVLMAMGSLGAAFRREEGDFPARPYLRPTPAARERWAQALGPRRKRLRIGLSWRGGVAETGRLARSIPLADLAPLLALEDCAFVSLQYGDVAAELAAVNAARADPIIAFPAERTHDFDDLAGLVANLDAVVSVQTAAVHLAGGLGVRCVAMLPRVAEWRYMRAGDRMPWYGSVRLFRQARPDDWTSVIEAVTRAMED